jgi:hypothetical protein
MNMRMLTDISPYGSLAPMNAGQGIRLHPSS